MIRAAGLCACVALAGSLGVARAQPQPSAKHLAAAAFAEGQRRYAAGDYAAAAANFLAAYDADPDPVYLFNAAQAFRFAGDCTEAATYYRKFLSVVSSAPNLERIRGYLDEMDRCAHRTAPPPAPSSPGPADAPAATPDTGATQRHIGLGFGAGGIAALAVGVWFHHDVGYFESRVAGCAPEHPCSAEQVDRWNQRGHTASVAAVASYSIAGAALIGGTALYLLGRRDSGEHAIAVGPTRGGAIVAAGFTF